jgi:hypothetical protein
VLTSHALYLRGHDDADDRTYAHRRGCVTNESARGCLPRYLLTPVKRAIYTPNVPKKTNLDTAFMIRCNSRDLARWKKHATELGFGGAAAWVRKVVNDEILARQKTKENPR